MITDLISIIVTAIASFFGGIFVERSRRRHEAKQAHLEQIKTVVLRHIKDHLIDHYLNILDYRQGALQVTSSPIRSQNVASSANTIIDWNYALSIAPPQISIERTIGSEIALQNHEETYPHLYTDAKAKHFSDLLSRWEQFEQKFQGLAQDSLGACQGLMKKLKEKVGLAPFSQSVQQGTWINYPKLSIFAYERLWGISNGTLRIDQEPTQSALHWFGERCGQGERGDLEKCQAVVDTLLDSEKASFQPLLVQARQLRHEAILIKDELERLLLTKKLPGRCSYA